MRSVGEILREARLEQKLDIDTLAARLKIQPKHLNSIEENELSKLPGVFFYRSFVQQYARALNLDSTEINQLLDLVLGSHPEPPLPGQDGLPVAPRRPPYGSGSRSRSLGVLVARLGIVVVGCTGVYAVSNNWTIVRAAASSVVNRVIEKHVDAPAPPIPRPAVVTSKSSAQSAAPNVAVSPPAEPGAGHLVLRLTATEPTWVSVVADGKPVFSGILQPSEGRSIDATTAKLTTGNAGGLSVEFNGKSIGAVGDRGQVRVVTFSPDRFEFNQSQPPSPTARAL